MRVVICDDHPVYRDGLRMLLAEVGVDVVGDAATGEDAVALVAEVRPDVAVMDLRLPGISGVEATRRIVEHDPQVAVLVLTMLDDGSSLLAALRAGARGYLLKGAGHEEVLAALQAVARGDLLVSASVAGSVRHGLSSAAPAAFPQLTAREGEVLELVARGHGNARIARSLFLSEKTVRNIVSNVLAKLGVASRAEAIALARDAGLGAATDTAG